MSEETATAGGTRERITLPSDLSFGKANRSIPKPKRGGRGREQAFYDVLAGVEAAAQTPGETFEVNGLDSDKQVEKVGRYIRGAAKELEIKVQVHPDVDTGSVLFLVKSETNGDTDAVDVVDEDDLADDDMWDDDDDDDDEEWEDD